MHRCVLSLLVLVLVMSSVTPLPAQAAWPTGDVVVCGAQDDQISLDVHSDGAGGAVLTWVDYRDYSLGLDPYLAGQRIDASGNAIWVADGRKLMNAVTGSSTASPRSVSDGAGGQHYIQTFAANGYYFHLLPDGSYDSLTYPVTLTSGTVFTSTPPVLASDGSGGAFVAWIDQRSLPVYQVFVQHVDATGTMLWATNGVAAGGDSWYSTAPLVVADGSGGVFILWNQVDDSIHAQHVLADGSLAWAPGGMVLVPSVAAETARAQSAHFDGFGGFLLVWKRSASSLEEIRIQRFDSSGQPQWAAPIAIVDDGFVNVGAARSDGGFTLAHNLWGPNPSIDGIDTSVMAWTGQGDPAWAASVELGNGPGTQFSRTIYVDAQDETWVVWSDERSGIREGYVQHLGADGSVLGDPAGTRVSAGPNFWSEAGWIVPGTDGPLLAYQDRRNGNTDIFMTALPGPTPVAVGQEGALARFDLRASPNPFGGQSTLSFRTRQDANVRLEIFDLSGRRVRSLWQGSVAAGRHAFVWDGRDAEGTRVAAGVYVARVAGAGAADTRRLIRVR